jgi:signal transduction histidine kinase
MPLANERRLAAVMQFAFAKPYEWLPREQDMLTLVAERCLVGAEKIKLMENLSASEEQVRELASRMLQVEEVERRRISRELHDEAGQSMLCIRLQLEMVEQMLETGGEAAVNESLRKLGEVREVTENTILEIRRLISALSPAVLEQLGLGPALRQLVSRYQRTHPQTRVRLSIGQLGRLPKKTESIVYRLAQECMNNIAKHSGAQRVNISVESADGSLQIVVEDDGVGFRLEEAYNKRDSFGLAGLRERVALLGGMFQVESRPRAEVPAAVPGERRTKRSLADAEFWRSGSSGTRIQMELPVPVETTTTAATA